MTKKHVTRSAQEARYKLLESDFPELRTSVVSSMADYLATPAGRGLVASANPKSYEPYDPSRDHGRPHDSTALDYITYVVYVAASDLNRTISGTKIDFIRNAKELLVTFDTLAVDMDLCHKKFFSKYESPFNMDITIQEEVRQLVLPRAIRSVMGYIDNYYYIYKLLQDLGLKQTYHRFERLLDNFAALEYGIFSAMKVLREHEEIGSRISIDKEVKRFILQFRGLMEAFSIDPIGAATVALRTKAQNIAVYNYCVAHDTLTAIQTGVERQVNIKKINTEYNRALTPIVESIAKYKKGDSGGTLTTPSSRYQDSEISFWDVSKHLVSFKDSMELVEGEMRNGILPSSTAMKGFESIVQQILIPYYAHQRGAINHTFITMISQLNRHYTMVLHEIISNSLPNNYSFDEAIGLTVDFEKALEDMQALRDKRRAAMANLGGATPNTAAASIGTLKTAAPPAKRRRFFGK